MFHHFLYLKQNGRHITFLLQFEMSIIRTDNRPTTWENYWQYFVTLTVTVASIRVVFLSAFQSTNELVFPFVDWNLSSPSSLHNIVIQWLMLCTGQDAIFTSWNSEISSSPLQIFSSTMIGWLGTSEWLGGFDWTPINKLTIMCVVCGWCLKIDTSINLKVYLLEPPLFIFWKSFGKKSFNFSRKN